MRIGWLGAVLMVAVMACSEGGGAGRDGSQGGSGGGSGGGGGAGSGGSPTTGGAGGGGGGGGMSADAGAGRGGGGGSGGTDAGSGGGGDSGGAMVDARPPGDGAGGAASAGRCGDITPANHPAFEAIKRLATTNSEVRILVYGQSISEQEWWTETRDWLKAQYPRGNLVMENRARGGCASQCLVGRESWGVDRMTRNRIPGDVLAWNPHLVILNVTGRHDDYEWVVKSFRQGCAAFDDHPVAAVRCPANARYPDYKPAEILLQTHHRLDDVNYTNMLPPLPPVPEEQWHYWMSTVWIPTVARKYGAHIAPVWDGWWAYMQANMVKARDLTSDGAHLNAAGNKLMAALTKPSLCYVPPP